MKKITLIFMFLIFSLISLARTLSPICGQWWKNYYTPTPSSNISSLFIYEDGNHSYEELQLGKDFFLWMDGIYLWYSTEKFNLNQKILIALSYVKESETYFLVDEGFWDEDFYGYNLDKNLEGGLSFSILPSMEYEMNNGVLKLRIRFFEESFYNYLGRDIVKGIVLLGSEEFNSYNVSDFLPFSYINYNGEEVVEISLNELPFPIITYSLLIDDNLNKSLEELPSLPFVAKPLIFGIENLIHFLNKSINLNSSNEIYLKAIIEKGYSNIEWKYDGKIDDKKFLISGGFDGENYYPIAEFDALNFSCFDGVFYHYSFEHFIGERSMGIFYKIETIGENDEEELFAWTRAREK